MKNKQTNLSTKRCHRAPSGSCEFCHNTNGLFGNAFCGLCAGFSTEPVASLAMGRLRVYYSRALRIPNFNLLAILVTRVRRERLGRQMPEIITEEPLISYGPQGWEGVRETGWNALAAPPTPAGTPPNSPWSSLFWGFCLSFLLALYLLPGC